MDLSTLRDVWCQWKVFLEQFEELSRAFGGILRDVEGVFGVIAAIYQRCRKDG